jgi:hypothetical protein
MERKKFTSNKIKVTTIIITIALVILLSLSSAGTLFTYNNNVLAKKQAAASESGGGGGQSGGGGNSGSDHGGGGGSNDNGDHKKGGGDNKDGTTSNNDNSGVSHDGSPSSSVATETRFVKPGEVLHHFVEHCTFGAKCRHPGDGFNDVQPPLPPSGPVSCVKECDGNTPNPPPATLVTCGPKQHFVETLGCVKDHLTHDEAFDLGCKLGINDGEDQENLVGTGPHSSGFIRGYNQGFAGHSCSRHSHGGGGNGINTIGGTTSPLTTTTKTTTTPVFKESTDIPVSTNVAVGPTTKTVDTAGWLHIVGDIKNSGKSSATIEPQISGRVMNANNQTIGIEYATPLSTTIQPGQSSAFEMLVGGTGIPNLNDIASIQYHVGIVDSSK